VIKPGHDESSLLAARAFAPVTRMRGNELIYKGLYPSPQPSPKGRGSLVGIAAKIVHDVMAIDLI
jgi:hypothetical protein